MAGTLPTLRRLLRRRSVGFTAVELLVASVMVSVTASVAVPYYDTARQRAYDHEALTSVRSGHALSKQVFMENGESYPDSDKLVLELTRIEPGTYTYRVGQADVSVSTGPGDLAYIVENEFTITVCARSKTGRSFCGRFVDGNANMMNAGGYAFASGTAAYAMGSGVLGEVDARASLPTVTAPPTANAGPTNTGQPIDLNTLAPKPVPATQAIPASAPVAPAQPSQPSQPSQPAQPVTPAPDLNFLVGPPSETQNRNASFQWENNGGVATAQTCKLDAVSYDCPLNSVSLNDLAYGSHSFEVATSGPGGSDSITYTWVVTTPPNDRLIVRADGDYATAAGSFKPTGAFEVGAWIRLYNDPQGGDATIASYGCTWSNGTGCASNGGWALSIEKKDMQPHLVVHTGANGAREWVTEESGKATNCPVDATAKVVVGKWQYVSAAYDPAGRITTWVDGKLAACSAGLGGLLPSVASNGPLMLGAQPNPALNLPASAFMNGAIGELRMTTGGAAANVSNPGPATGPGVLSSPAENGRAADFMFHFSDWTDSMGKFANVQPRGNAHLAYSDEG